MKEKSFKNVMQAYPSNIFAHKGESIDILSNFPAGTYVFVIPMKEKSPYYPGI